MTFYAHCCDCGHLQQFSVAEVYWFECTKCSSKELQISLDDIQMLHQERNAPSPESMPLIRSSTSLHERRSVRFLHPPLISDPPPPSGQSLSGIVDEQVSADSSAFVSVLPVTCSLQRNVFVQLLFSVAAVGFALQSFMFGIETTKKATFHNVAQTVSSGVQALSQGLAVVLALRGFPHTGIQFVVWVLVGAAVISLLDGAIALVSAGDVPVTCDIWCTTLLYAISAVLLISTAFCTQAQKAVSMPSPVVSTRGPI